MLADDLLWIGRIGGHDPVFRPQPFASDDEVVLASQLAFYLGEGGLHEALVHFQGEVDEWFVFKRGLSCGGEDRIRDCHNAVILARMDVSPLKLPRASINRPQQVPAVSKQTGLLVPGGFEAAVWAPLFYQVTHGHTLSSSHLIQSCHDGEGLVFPAILTCFPAALNAADL